MCAISKVTIPQVKIKNSDYKSAKKLWTVYPQQTMMFSDSCSHLFGRYVMYVLQHTTGSRLSDTHWYQRGSDN